MEPDVVRLTVLGGGELGLSDAIEEADPAGDGPAGSVAPQDGRNPTVAAQTASKRAYLCMSK